MELSLEEKRSILSKQLELPSVGLVEHYPRTWEDSWAGDYYGIEVNHKIYIDSEEALEIIMPLLSLENPTIRHHAIWLLGYFGYRIKAAIPKLLELLKSDPDFRVTINAVYTLGKISHNETVVLPELIMIMIHNSNPSLRQAAAHAIGDFGEKAHSVKDDLLYVLKNDNNYQVRAMAAKSLGQLKLLSKDIEQSLLLTIEYDDNSWVRINAVESIASLNYKEHIPFLVALINSKKENREKFAFALAVFRLDNSNNKAIDTFNNMLNNDELSSYEIHQLIDCDFLHEDYLFKKKINQLKS
ncbi:MAG: HEAT repeat domain-containing protein [Asgard group archaeon]|nr:HEAT repeat domain-containing protein [Asgard group archaeon]